ncbi:hypothetical protein CBS101457_001823 [Exobasidium rhododendri]|nr:hypothetical protein CBS101457_001823 [Exobasidium rhododendri]
MSSGFVKSKLKASREAIQGKKWETAVGEASQVLEYEADNYNAQVFRGLALLHLQRYDESEEAYRAATTSQPSQVLAWQGLEKFYREREAWKQLSEVLRRLMDLALAAGDVQRCAEGLQRLVDLQREEGTRMQRASALSAYLPDSKYYSLLSKLPLPDQTNPQATTTFASEMAIHVNSIKVLEEVIELIEEVEKDSVDKELDKRRTRLGSANKSRDALRNEVGVEVWRDSRLPDLYEQVLSHINATDEMRREAEHKLLLFRYKFLRALPNPASKLAGPSGTSATEDSSEKDKLQMKEKYGALQGFLSLASGVVAIDIPDELAWSSTLGWQDVFSPVNLPAHQLRAFVDHFPRSGVSFSFRALLYIIKDEQFMKEEKERFEAQDVDMPLPDPLFLAISGQEEAPQSILAARIAASFYLLDRDWLSCSDVAMIGLELARKEEVEFAVDLGRVKAGLESCLGSALTHLHPPQHHARALRLSDSVLAKVPHDIEALFCKAHIARVAGRWDQARELFSSIVQSTQGHNDLSMTEKNLQKLLLTRHPEREARLEMAWCDVNLGRLEQGKEELQHVIDEMDASSDVSKEDQARAWWRLGYCLWRMGGSHREETSQAFTCFITALKHDASYASAFTSLGVYYSEVSQPADLVRANKCFQKAFELDAREDEAARRLAQSYADDNDWDLVYLVARRTIEGEGGSLALTGEVRSQRRHVTRNAWAWTAIGSTELVREDFEKAIVAFQIALRSFPGDGTIWMRLGEAYVASGRLDAGIKTFEKAREILLDTEEAWQPTFSIAIVQKQQGKYLEALALLQDLCVQEPDKIAIKVTCAETRLCLALYYNRRGYTMRGKDCIVTALKEAKEVLAEDNPSLAAWKVIADCLFHYSTLTLDHDDGDQSLVLEMSQDLLRASDRYNVDDGLPSISSVSAQTVLSDVGSKRKALALNVYLNKLRVLLHHNDEQVASSVWMDLTQGLHQLSIQQSDQHDIERAKESKNQAIACAKEALKMEPGNGRYWNALGDLVFESSVKLAQHCYIKAIESDPKDVVSWTNLGFLYLYSDDDTLAKECFIKAQTFDSDYVPAWVGHSLIAKKAKNEKNFLALSKHAYALNEGSNLEASYGFASSLFKASSSSSSNGAMTSSQLHSASFALSSYLTHRPLDVSALHLSALFAEQLGELEMAIERVEKASTILEGQYEEDESTEKARLYAVCMVNLGRIRLANGDYEGAKEAFEMGSSLLVADDDDEEGRGEDALEAKGKEATRATLNISTALVLTPDDLKRARAGAHCGGGIAQFAAGEEEEAITTLRLVMEEEEGEDEPPSSDSREQLQLLLAQMLWHAGEKEGAESTVLDIITSRPKSVLGLLTLGSICVLNDDQEQLALLEAEMKSILGGEKTSAIEAFLSLSLFAKGEGDRAIKNLQRQVLSRSSIASQLQLTKMSLQVALRCRFHLDHSVAGGEETTEGEEQRALLERIQNAKEEAGRLLEFVQSEHDLHYHISSLSCMVIALVLERKKEEAVQMVMRIVSLEPHQLAHWTLLESVQNIPESNGDAE